MGWFKDLKNSVGRKIGKVVEKTGNILHSEIISQWGRDIQDKYTERVASEKSYDKREANIYTTERLNEILVSFSEGYFQQVIQIENTCVKLVKDYYDTLIDIIENAPGSVHSSANLRALKAAKSRISKTIMGRVKEPLAKRMSLDDAECLSILKMDAGLEKKQAMTRFTNKVIKEALDNLARSVRISLYDCAEDIQDYLSEISEEQERAMQALKEHFDKMARDNTLEQSDKEKSCIQPLYLIDATECVSKILR